MLNPWFSDVRRFLKNSFFAWRLTIGYQTRGLLDPLFSSDYLAIYTIYYDKELGFPSLENWFIQMKNCTVGANGLLSSSVGLNIPVVIGKNH